MCNIITIFLCLFLSSKNLLALPIGFNVNQGKLEYNEITSPYFFIYHEKSVPIEAAMVANTLHAAKPILEKWFKRIRTRPLPIILSATTQNASFANFVTDSIELQTKGSGHRDLFLHEYTHSSMYRHFDNIFGPAGSILHLPWMPAWFIEGLAEAFSASDGSGLMASIERYQALSQDWPSYDRLHSLYGSDGFSERGYATSGAFVRWLLLTKNSESLIQLLEDFYYYSMPWFYPWSFNPISDFLPFDAALLKNYGAKGEDLYEQYKKESFQYWHNQKQNNLFVNSSKLKPKLYNYTNSLSYIDGKSLISLQSNRKHAWYELSFNENLFSSEHTKIGRDYPQYKTLLSHISFSGFDFSVFSDIEPDTRLRYHQFVKLKNKNNSYFVDKVIYTPRGFIYNVVESKNKIFWLQKFRQENSICFINKEDLLKKNQITKNEIYCPIRAQLPKKINILGYDKKNKKIVQTKEDTLISSQSIKKIWFSIQEQKLLGDTYEIKTLDTDDMLIANFPYKTGGKPISIMSRKNKIFLFLEEYNRRSLKLLNQKGSCLKQYDFDDLINKFEHIKNDDFIVSLFKGNKEAIKKVNTNNLKENSCRISLNHKSPLLWALGQNQVPDLMLALNESNFRTDASDSNIEKKQIQNNLSIQQAQALDQASPETGGLSISYKDSKPRKWRARPIFAIPFIGLNDIYGYQLGTLSIPIMDHLQNETVLASLLFGIKSNYPDIFVSLVSTRYTPTLSITAYRRQRWNGRSYYLVSKDYNFERDESNNDTRKLIKNYHYDLYMNPGKDNKIIVNSSYLDEKGVRFSAFNSWHTRISTKTLSLRLNVSHRNRYFGYLQPIEGQLIQPNILISYLLLVNNWALRSRLIASIAPEGLNKYFAFNRISSSIRINRNIRELNNTIISFGLSGARTRGKKGKTPQLKEFYRPLDTFIPGSGMGLNNNSFGLLGRGSLFLTRFGDTKMRAFAQTRTSVIRNINKLFWVLYLQSLELTNFINYGNTWHHEQKVKPPNILSYGSNLDLFVENKGVNFYTGLGLGKVHQRNLQLYIRFGFDALF